MSPMGNKIARWISEEELDPKMSSSRNLLCKDIHGNPVFLFENTCRKLVPRKVSGCTFGNFTVGDSFL